MKFNISKYSDGNGNTGRIAHVEDVTFFAYPHQPFYARCENTDAICNNILVRGKPTETGGHETDEKWSATISHCNPDGTSEPIEQKHFDNSDDMFQYAYDKLKQEYGK